MKKLFAVMLVLCLSLFCAVAGAENGKCDISFEGTTYHLEYRGWEIVGGELHVFVGGFGSTLPMRNGSTVIIAWAAVVVDGEEVEAKSVSAGSDGVYTFVYDEARNPDKVIVYPYEQGQEPAVLWAAGEQAADAGGSAQEPQEDAGSYEDDVEQMKAMLQKIRNGELPKLEGEPSFEGKLAFHIRSESNYSNSINCVNNGIPFYKVPADALAGRLSEASTAVFIRFVGGENGMNHTRVEAVDLASGAMYPPFDAETVPTSEFRPQDAVAWVLAVRDGEPLPAAQETAPAPEAAQEAPAAAEVTLDDILDALGNDNCRTTYQALLEGEVIKKGSKGDAAKGVQQTLVDFGKDIAVDGSVGPKTIGALNEVQAAFGLEETESLDAEGYAQLLPRLLVATRPEEAEALLSGSMKDGEYEYISACACVAQGKLYQARQMFLSSGYGDSVDRAAACVLEWPKNGQIYKNSAVKGGSTDLTVKVTADADRAMVVKVYTQDGQLARAMFIGGTGKATVNLAAGTYIIKDGTGKDWYGLEDAFGREGYYEIMTFGDGEEEVKLKSNRIYTITVNVDKVDPNTDGVGSQYESWNQF